MKTEGLSFFTDTHITVLALVIFFCSFAAVLIWSYRLGSKAQNSQAALLPLQEETSHE